MPRTTGRERKTRQKWREQQKCKVATGIGKGGKLSKKSESSKKKRPAGKTKFPPVSNKHQNQ